MLKMPGGEPTRFHSRISKMYEYLFTSVKIINKKTGEVTTLPEELVEEALEEARDKWINDILYGYEKNE